MVNSKIRALILVILFSSCASADVAFVDSVSQTGSETTILNFDPGSGITDGLIIFAITFEDNDFNAAESGATYDGTAMTKAILLHKFEIGGRNGGMIIYYLLDADWDGAADATSDAIISWNNAPQSGETVLSLSVWSGVDQTTPIADTAVKAQSGLGPITLTLTAGAGTMTFQCGMYGHGTGGSFSQDNGAAELFDLVSSGASSLHTAAFKANHTTPSMTVSGVASSRSVAIAGIVMGAASGAAADYPRRRRRIH